MNHKNHHMWTKDEVKKLFSLWESTNIEDVAKALKVETSQVRSMVTAMRKSGFPLSRKRRNSYIRLLLDDVKKELKIK